MHFNYNKILPLRLCFLASKYLIFVNLIIFAFSIGRIIGRRDGDGRETGMVSMDNLMTAKGTCVNGYCLDPSYKKLELPPTSPAQVRINLEVNL